MKLPHLPDWAWLLAILAGALALRVVTLGRADLWTDEIQTLHAVSLGWGEMVRERLHAGHGPLYFVIEKAWCSIAGTSQFALRLPAAVFGVALLVPLWSLARRLLGRPAAWWAAVFAACHPLLVELSREARMYSLLALAALVVTDRAAATLDGERPGPRFWIAAAAGPFVHATWGFALLCVAVWLAFERMSSSPDARRACGRALAGVIGTLAILVAFLFVVDPQHQVLVRRPWHREAAVFVLRIFTGSDLSIFHSFLAGAAVVLYWAIFMVLGLVSCPPRARRLAAGWLIGVPAATVLVGVAGGVPWGPARYIQIAAFGAILVAAAAAGSMDAARGGRAPLFALVLALLTSLAPVHTQWSDAAARLAGGPSHVVVDDESSRIVLSHYLGRDVHVGAPPAGATSWRRAVLRVDGAGRVVEITDEPRPR